MEWSEYITAIHRAGYTNRVRVGKTATTCTSKHPGREVIYTEWKRQQLTNIRVGGRWTVPSELRRLISAPLTAGDQPVCGQAGLTREDEPMEWHRDPDAGVLCEHTTKTSVDVWDLDCPSRATWAAPLPGGGMWRLCESHVIALGVQIRAQS